MDKIIELVYEEARRRPGKDLVSKIHHVMLDVRLELMEVMDRIKESERHGHRLQHLDREDDNDP